MKPFLFVLALVGGTLGAATVNCPSDSVCNGNIYTVTHNSLGGNLFEITIGVNTTGYTGSAPAGLDSIAIKSFSSGAHTGVSFTATGGSNNPTWTLFDTELNANGCAGGNSGSLCAAASTPYLFTKGDALSFTFTFSTTGAPTSTLHLKYNFVAWNANKDEWKKEGDLGSFDIKSDPFTPVNEGEIPEPATYALIGGSLLGLAMLRRKA